VAEPTVAKEYKEELGERDAGGFYDYAYRWWEYRFDFGTVCYRARVYDDEPHVAYVMELDGRLDDPPRDEVLRVVAAHLAADGVREFHMLGPSGGFERVSPP
jgi:hypothetical protein